MAIVETRRRGPRTASRSPPSAVGACPSRAVRCFIYVRDARPARARAPPWRSPRPRGPAAGSGRGTGRRAVSPTGPRPGRVDATADAEADGLGNRVTFFVKYTYRRERGSNGNGGDSGPPVRSVESRVAWSSLLVYAIYNICRHARVDLTRTCNSAARRGAFMPTRRYTRNGATRAGRTFERENQTRRSCAQPRQETRLTPCAPVGCTNALGMMQAAKVSLPRAAHHNREHLL